MKSFFKLQSETTAPEGARGNGNNKTLLQKLMSQFCIKKLRINIRILILLCFIQQIKHTSRTTEIQILKNDMVSLGILLVINSENDGRIYILNRQCMET